MTTILRLRTASTPSPSSLLSISSRHGIKQSHNGIIQDTLMILFWLLIFLMFFGSLQLYLARVSSSTRFERIKTANDLALLATAAPIPPANFDLTNLALNHHTTFDHGTVRVTTLDEQHQASVEEHAPYALRNTMPLTTDILPPGIYQLTRNGQELRITPKQGLGIPPLSKLTCPPFIPTQHIIIDPGHGGLTPDGDPGVLIDNIPESELTTIISKELQIHLSTNKYTASLTRPDNTPITWNTRTSRIPAQATLLSIHIHPTLAHGTSTATAYIDANQPRKATSIALACNTLNTLLADETLKIQGANMVLVDTSTPLQNEDRHEDTHILSNAQVGIVLVLNGMSPPASTTLPTFASIIGKQLSTTFTKEETSPATP